MRKLIVLLIILSIPLTGCSGSSTTVDKDILTQKRTEEGRIQITINVKHALTINNFEKEIEKRFPNVDLVLVANYTDELGIKEYEKRLKNDDLADIVITWPINVGEEYLSDRLIDLSSYEFSSRYNVAMLDNIVINGELYYLPGPAQIRGIVYNKTLFNENGWSVPNNYDEFIDLCQQIENSGIKALQLSFENKEVLDTAFIGFNFADYYSKIEDRLWIDKYNNGEGLFLEHFDGALDNFTVMVNEGIFTKEDLNINYAEREDLLINRKAAMTEDSLALAQLLMNNQEEFSDEYGIMPLFNDSKPSDWARLYMVCYIGLNKHLLDNENKEKFEIALEIMDYISTSEGQKILASDSGTMYSSLTGVSIDNNGRQVEDIKQTLDEGRYAIFNEFERAKHGFRNALEGLINKTISKEEAAEMIDEDNKTIDSNSSKMVIGRASEDFSLINTGSLLTDLMVSHTGAEIALFLDNGKDGKRNARGLKGKLYHGEITTEDVKRVLPSPYHEGSDKVITVKLTGAEIIDTLENSINILGDSGWIYYFSGLKVEYSPTAKQGYRIKSIKLNSGDALELEKEYTVAIADKSINEQFIEDKVEYEFTIEELFIKGISELGEVSPAKDNRFIVID